MTRKGKIEIRVSEDEKASWHEQAQAEGMSLSELIRQRMSGAGAGVGAGVGIGLVRTPEAAEAEEPAPAAFEPVEPTAPETASPAAKTYRAPVLRAAERDGVSPEEILHRWREAAKPTAPVEPEPEPAAPVFSDHDLDPNGELDPGRLAILRGVASNTGQSLESLVGRELHRQRESHYVGATR